MLKWLFKKNIEDFIAEGEYLQAVAAIHEELQKDPPPVRSRPLRERLSDVLVELGELPSAAQILRELAREYTQDRDTARAIAIQKKLQGLTTDEGEIQKDVDAIALAAAWGIPKRPAPADLIEMPEELANDLATSVEPAAPPAGAQVEPGGPQAALAATELFGDFSPDELAAVIREMKLRILEPGELVMAEGEETRSLYVLTQGTVRVYVRSEGGESVQIREISAVAFFGEISVVYQKPRTATLTCKTRCQLLELRIESVLKIAIKHPRVKQVLKVFCDRRAGSPEEVAGRKSGHVGD